MTDRTLVADPTWPDILTALLTGTPLDDERIDWVADEIFVGRASEAQIAGFLMALRAKGETPAEVTGLVRGLLRHATPMAPFPHAVDVVGTGGDRAGTVNISTMAAIVVAAADVPVAKHGNRASSSLCGSADLLEELGVVIDLGPDEVARCVTEAGIGFCFAPRFHPAMRHAAAARRSLGVPTVFNFLGPLSNPAQPNAFLLGCADLRMAPVMAGVLASRGCSALVARGEDGLDEFTVTAPTRVWVVTPGMVRETVVDAADLGLSRAPVDALRGGEPAHNAKVVAAVFAGEPGAVRDAVVLNAAAAMAAHAGLSDDDASLMSQLREQINRAERAIDTGKAQSTLDRWIAVSTQPH